MTLGDCLESFANNPSLILGYSISILVIIGVLHFIVGKEDALISPWRYIYSTLVYAVTIPGLAAVFFNIYLFLFERQPIMETNLLVQILPIILMVVALVAIKQTVSLIKLPGFNTIPTLMMTITIVLILMWVLDRTRVLFGVFSFLPIQYVLLIFVGLFIGMKFLMGRAFK
jgi:hypothetical protein